LRSNQKGSDVVDQSTALPLSEKKVLRQAFFDQGFSDDGNENPNESLLTFPHKTLGVKCPLGNYDLRPKPSFTPAFF
jgi:hypothetical protein